jgi:hypothetical protein
MNALALGYLIGFGLITIRIIWCHFDAKKMEKWENEKIEKGYSLRRTSNESMSLKII